MSTINSTTSSTTSASSSNVLKRRRFNPEDFTIRGVASDVLVGVGASVKNTALLGVTAVQVVNAWIPLIETLGFTSVEAGETFNKVLRRSITEINLMIKEWDMDSCFPKEIDDMNISMDTIVEKTWAARKEKKAVDAKSKLISKVKASSHSEEVKEELIRIIEEESSNETKIEKIILEVSKKLEKKMEEESSSN